MEGNFYVSTVVVQSELRSKLGRAYEHCRHFGLEYAKCVEIHHANRDIKQDVCVEQRQALNKCVDTESKKSWPTPLAPRSISSLAAGGATRVIRHVK